ncbi:hypothetical protein N665_0820s0002 [Sinapis alba]|nr:hypothetical protein N665_0820s0002 [Sinapis alba]
MQHYFLKLHPNAVRSQKNTSSLSSLDLWSFGSLRNSCVSLRHSSKLSGATKSSATFMQDCKQFHT